MIMCDENQAIDNRIIPPHSNQFELKIGVHAALTMKKMIFDVFSRRVSFPLKCGKSFSGDLEG